MIKEFGKKKNVRLKTLISFNDFESIIKNAVKEEPLFFLRATVQIAVIVLLA